MDMSLDFSEIYISLVSNIIGIDLKQIKRVLDKEKLRKSGQVEISDSIDVVSKKLEESKNIIDNALLEMEKQKKLFVQMKKDAEISQQVSEMNKQQVEALNVLGNDFFSCLFNVFSNKTFNASTCCLFISETC